MSFATAVQLAHALAALVIAVFAVRDNIVEQRSHWFAIGSCLSGWLVVAFLAQIVAAAGMFLIATVHRWQSEMFYAGHFFGRLALGLVFYAALSITILVLVIAWRNRRFSGYGDDPMDKYFEG